MPKLLLMGIVLLVGVYLFFPQQFNKNGYPDPSPSMVPDVAVKYSCDNKKTIAAIYLNTKNQVTLKLSDGRMLILDHATSADGARYANKDESIVFWSRGNTAFMTENGRSTYSNCHE